MNEIARYKSTINGNANTPNSSIKVIDNAMRTYLSKFPWKSKPLNFKEISGTSAISITEKITTNVDKTPSRIKISASNPGNPSVPNPNHRVKAIEMKNKVFAGVGKPIK